MCRVRRVGGRFALCHGTASYLTGYGGKSPDGGDGASCGSFGEQRWVLCSRLLVCTPDCRARQHLLARVANLGQQLSICLLLSSCTIVFTPSNSAVMESDQKSARDLLSSR